MSRLLSVILPVALLLGCQSAATTPPASGLTPVSASHLPLFYTHKGADELYHAARYSDAESMCLQAVGTIEKASPDKGGGKNSPRLAPPLIDLATIYMRLAKFDKAKAVIDRAQSVLNPDIPEQALLLGRLGINKGWRIYSLGETEAALKVFQDARALLEKNQKGETADLAEIINNIALMESDIGSDNDDEQLLARARAKLIQAWQMRRRITGENSPETGESLNNLGMDLLLNPRNGADFDRALPVLQKSLDIAITVYGQQNPETAVARTNVALACMLHDDLENAEKQLKIAIPITLRFLGEQHPDRAYELIALGRIYQEQSHLDEAEKTFLEAVRIDEAVYGKNHPNVAPSLEYLAHLYEARGDESKEAEIRRRIERIGGKGI